MLTRKSEMRQLYAIKTAKAGARLRQLREENKLPQKEAASRLDITPATYWRYETASYTLPLDILLRAADVYNVSTDYILGLTDVKERYPASSDDPEEQSESKTVTIPPDTYKGFVDEIKTLSETLAALQAEHSELVEEVMQQMQTLGRNLKKVSR